MFDFERFPTLHTERLTLRELTPDDAADVFAFRSDPLVTRLNIGAPYDLPEQALALVAGIRQNFADRSELRWGITLTQFGRVIGMCGFNYWNRHDRRASVGFDLSRRHWGQGIMPEALRAVLRFGFTQMHLHRIEADCSAENHNSRRVLEKLGFRHEGCLRDQYFDEDRFHDLLLFALLLPEWGGG